MDIDTDGDTAQAIQLTLDSVIDPSLASPPPNAPNGNDELEDDSVPPDHNSDSATDGKKGKDKRPRKILLTGSEADFKRKEANRLAAERSRSRTTEKNKALNKAYAVLSTEHDELAAAIAEMEAAAEVANAESERKARQERQERDQREVEAQVEAAIASAQQEMEGSGGTGTVGSGDRDRDERSLLAALMSGGMGMEGFENVGDDWVQGVESLMKEVESSGRLGELAAVAAVPIDQEDVAVGDVEQQSQEPDQHQGEGEEGVGEGNEASQKEAQGEMDVSMGKLAEELMEESRGETISPPKMTEFIYNPTEAAAATANAVAIVLNAEIEKAVRDEVALTRAAIVRIEKEISKANGNDVEVEAGPPLLESDTFSNDQAELEKSLVAAEEIRVALEATMEEMTANVVAARVAKDHEEAKVAKGVEELHRIAQTVDDEEREKIMDVLKSIRGYIGNHIWGLKDDTNSGDTLLGTSFSTPAIARRRRGRPPKNSFPLRYNHASLIYPTIPLDSPISTASPSTSTSTPVTDGPKKRRVARGLPKRSKLSSNVITADSIPTSVAHAEEYILSHLQAANENEDGNENTGADVGGGGGEGSGAEHSVLGMAIDPAFQSPEWTESVLSKLKKGGPGSCDICARTETSVWRKLTLGGEDYRVCNACGLYQRRFGVIRPPSLWGDGEAVKKRRAPTGPDDGRRNRKVKKMLQTAEDQLQEAQVAAEAEADAAALAAEAAVIAAAEAEAEGADVMGEHEQGLREAAEAAQAQDQVEVGMNVENGDVGGSARQGMGQGEEEGVTGQRQTGVGVGVGGGNGNIGVGVGGGDTGEGDIREGGQIQDNHPHVDVDPSGFEAIEQELRGLHGDSLFAGLDD